MRSASKRAPRWRWLIVLGLTLGLLAGVAWAMPKVTASVDWPVKKLVVEGALRHVSEESLRSLVLDHVREGFFETEVEVIRERTEALAWVRSAAVRRVWPDTLAITISEHEPLARWNDSELVSVEGTLFAPVAAEIPAQLPRFAGPRGSQRLLVDLYARMRALLQSQELSIAVLEMDERHALRLTLNNDIVVLLGREEPLERLGLLVWVYPHVLAQRANEVISVDLRYTNGFAVNWAPSAQAVSAPNAGSDV